MSDVFARLIKDRLGVDINMRLQHRRLHKNGCSKIKRRVFCNKKYIFNRDNCVSDVIHADEERAKEIIRDSKEVYICGCISNTNTDMFNSWSVICGSKDALSILAKNFTPTDEMAKLVIHTKKEILGMMKKNVKMSFMVKYYICNIAEDDKYYLIGHEYDKKTKKIFRLNFPGGKQNIRYNENLSVDKMYEGSRMCAFRETLEEISMGLLINLGDPHVHKRKMWNLYTVDLTKVSALKIIKEYFVINKRLRKYTLIMEDELSREESIKKFMIKVGECGKRISLPMFGL